MTEPRLIGDILMEELQRLYTPGTDHPQSVGSCILKKVKDFYGETLPVPSDFKPMPSELLRKLRPLTLQATPADPTEQQVRDYLQAIGISLQTACDLGLCYQPMDFFREAKNGGAAKDGTSDKDGKSSPSQKITLPALAYPFTVEGKWVSVKLRSCARIPSLQTDRPASFTKDWHQITSHSEMGITPCFIDTLHPSRLQGKRVPRLILTEGEKDCLALYEAGYRYFFSVPCGASSEPAKYLAPFVEWLKAVDSVVICGDTDFPGRRMVQELCEFFGSLSYLVDLPDGCKDIAEVLVKYGPEMVQQVIEGAHPKRSNAIRTVAQDAAQIKDYLRGNYDRGFDVGFGPLTDRVFHLDRNGGLIVITGHPNCGKTTFLKNLCMNLMLHHQMNVLILSFESGDKPKYDAEMVRIMHRTADLSQMPDEDLDKTMLFLNQHMAHLDLNGESHTPEHIVELADQYRNSQGLHMLVIDPYLFIEFQPRSKNESETESIKRMLTLFQSWGQTHHVWVCIAAHPRKSQGTRGGFSSDSVSPDDIAASAHWNNLADYLFALKRVNEENARYTELHMMKVRDQSLCQPGCVYYVCTSSGNYLEQASPQHCTAWYHEHAFGLRSSL